MSAPLCKPRSGEGVLFFSGEGVLLRRDYSQQVRVLGEKISFFDTAIIGISPALCNRNFKYYHTKKYFCFEGIKRSSSRLVKKQGLTLLSAAPPKGNPIALMSIRR